MVFMRWIYGRTSARSSEEEESLQKCYHSQRTLLWMNLSNEPFIVLYTCLPFILRKYAEASILQLTILAMLRPVLPLFAFYWSAYGKNHSGGLKKNLMWAWFLARFPFILTLFIDNGWYLLFCCATYEIFHKSGGPAIMELLRQNIPKKNLETIFVRFFRLGFLEGVFLGLLLPWAIQSESIAWKRAFFGATLISLSSLWAQYQIPTARTLGKTVGQQTPAAKSVWTPWKESWALLKRRPDFAWFQAGFTAGGFGLMVSAPALAVYYVDVLALDATAPLIGRSIFMGCAVLFFSNLWARWLQSQAVLQVTKRIVLLFAIYIVSLLLAQFYRPCFYAAFFIYGIAQAGSSTLWNLSGPIFSNQEDSAPYSRVNILMIGIRGLVAPLLGGILCAHYGPQTPLIVGASCCLIGFFLLQCHLFKIGCPWRKKSAAGHPRCAG